MHHGTISQAWNFDMNNYKKKRYGSAPSERKPRRQNLHVVTSTERWYPADTEESDATVESQIYCFLMKKQEV